MGIIVILICLNFLLSIKNSFTIIKGGVGYEEKMELRQRLDLLEYQVDEIRKKEEKSDKIENLYKDLEIQEKEWLKIIGILKKEDLLK